MAQAPVRVLIVDDSALMREMLKALLSRDKGIVVVDTASDPFIAREKIKLHNPDVITLDIEMPRMNGIEFLSRLMSLRPTPVIMFSSLTQEGAEASLRALELGAFDVLGKPAGFVENGMEELADDLIQKVKAAAKMKLSTQANPRPPKTMPGSVDGFRPLVIAVGASTGGVPVIGRLLEAMPGDAPPILITQHMPPGFTARFAQRVNENTAIRVTEARHGECPKPGHAYIAPGGLQMRLIRRGSDLQLSVKTEPKINGFCPSVDALFHSVAESQADKAIGVLLTGMGSDGASGLKAMRDAGALTLAQDEASCVVFGMPRAAEALGAVERFVSASRLPEALLDAARLPAKRVG